MAVRELWQSSRPDSFWRCLLRVTGGRDGEYCDQLYWRAEPDGRLTVLVRCSDCFALSTADAEEIECWDDLDQLETALRETEAIDSPDDTVWGPLLYCARRRQMKPLAAVLARMPPAVRRLFEALP